MKLYKILMMALAVLSLSACSDDDNDTNTAGNVTVCMEQAEISVRESHGLFKVPVIVTGEPNGPVRVTVNVEEVAPSPAMSDVHYMVTSKTIIIPSDEKAGYIEIKTVDNTEENEPRVFNVTIESAEGATIGTPTTTTVTIKDDDSDPYIKLCGTWKFTAYDIWTDEPVEQTLNMGTPAADDDYYGLELYATGLEGYDFILLPFTYHYNDATEEVSMSIDLGQLMCNSAINFGGSIGTGVLIASSVINGQLASQGGSLAGEVNSDLNEITFDPNDLLYGRIAQYPSMTLTQSMFCGYYGMKLVKVQ